MTGGGGRGLRAESGVSLLEVAVSATVLGFALAGLFGVLERMQVVEQESVRQAEMRVRARMALNRIVRELRDAGVSKLVPEQFHLGTRQVDYRRAIGYENGNVIYGPLCRILWRLEPGEIDDGADNDGDGVADEGEVVWIENADSIAPREVVLCTGVAELGQEIGSTIDEKPNGLDDNGNGVTDEAGLSFETDGNEPGVVRIRLTLVRAGRDGRPIYVSARTDVLVRNP